MRLISGVHVAMGRYLRGEGKVKGTEVLACDLNIDGMACVAKHSNTNRTVPSGILILLGTFLSIDSARTRSTAALTMLNSGPNLLTKQMRKSVKATSQLRLPSSPKATQRRSMRRTRSPALASTISGTCHRRATRAAKRNAYH